MTPGPRRRSPAQAAASCVPDRRSRGCEGRARRVLEEGEGLERASARRSRAGSRENTEANICSTVGRCADGTGVRIGELAICRENRPHGAARDLARARHGAHRAISRGPLRGALGRPRCRRARAARARPPAPRAPRSRTRRARRSPTPSCSAPPRTSSRLTAAANDGCLSFFLTDLGVRPWMPSGRTQAQATRKPQSSSTASSVRSSSVSARHAEEVGVGGDRVDHLRRRVARARARR